MKETPKCDAYFSCLTHDPIPRYHKAKLPSPIHARPSVRNNRSLSLIHNSLYLKSTCLTVPASSTWIFILQRSSAHPHPLQSHPLNPPNPPILIEILSTHSPRLNDPMLRRQILFRKILAPACQKTIIQNDGQTVWPFDGNG